MCLRRNLKRVAFKCILILPILYFTLFLIVTILVFTNPFNLASEQFLETHKCPICYGDDWCSILMAHANEWHIDYEWNVLATTRMWQSLINIKNVFVLAHNLDSNRKMVLKKLAHNDELSQFDLNEQTCHNSKCLTNLLLNRNIILNKKLTYKELKSINNDLNIELLSCFSDRLVDILYGTSPKIESFMDFNLNMLTKLKINPEPLILQVYNYI